MGGNQKLCGDIGPSSLVSNSFLRVEFGESKATYERLVFEKSLRTHQQSIGRDTLEVSPRPMLD